MTQPTDPTATGKFHPGMTMDEATRLDERVQWVLREFHVGGCHHCGFDASDTIEKVAQDNGIPVDVLVSRLHAVCR